MCLIFGGTSYRSGTSYHVHACISHPEQLLRLTTCLFEHIISGGRLPSNVQGLLLLEADSNGGRGRKKTDPRYQSL